MLPDHFIQTMLDEWEIEGKLDGSAARLLKSVWRDWSDSGRCLCVWREMAERRKREHRNPQPQQVVAAPGTGRRILWNM